MQEAENTLLPLWCSTPTSIAVGVRSRPRPRKVQNISVLGKNRSGTQTQDRARMVRLLLQIRVRGFGAMTRTALKCVLRGNHDACEPKSPRPLRQTTLALSSDRFITENFCLLKPPVEKKKRAGHRAWAFKCHPSDLDKLFGNSWSNCI